MNWKPVFLIVTALAGIIIGSTTDACMVFRMNNFDIIHGMAIEPLPKDGATAGKAAPSESTQWATFSDLTNRVLYFRTYDNFNLRKVEFRKLDFATAGVKRIPMFGAAESITDVSSLAR